MIKKIIISFLAFFGLTAAYNAYTVISNGSNQRVERARIANNGTCSITSQSGSWIASISHPATGSCQLTLATPKFSASPNCTIATSQGGGVFGYFGGPPSANTIDTTTRQVPSSGSSFPDIDFGFDIICMGPR